MKKFMAFVLVLVCMLSFVACGNQTLERTKTIENGLRTYHKMSDGTWECEGHTYKYRLEITGRMHSAKADSTFVYLSNLASISFDQAAGAAGLSSNSEDYFSPDEAVLVDWR